jgi:hypothetical protein
VVFTLSQAAAPAFAVVCMIVIGSAFWAEPRLPGAVAMASAALIVMNFSVYRYFVRARGIAFAIAAAPVHTLMQCLGGLALFTGRLMRDAVGDRQPDAATQAYAEVGLEKWPPVRRPQ